MSRNHAEQVSRPARVTFGRILASKCCDYCTENVIFQAFGVGASGGKRVSEDLEPPSLWPPRKITAPACYIRKRASRISESPGQKVRGLCRTKLPSPRAASAY